jgi:hypothetical protein
MVAMAKEEWGKAGKNSRNINTAPAKIRSMRGKSEKSKVFFIASIQTSLGAEIP